MFLRDFYKKKHRSSGNPNDWLEYKKLRNIVNIEHANAKKDYFAHKLSQTNYDIKRTWKILNSALGRRSKTTTIEQLRVNGTDFTEPDKLSEQFNKYFCNIAFDILKESEEFDSSDISFESYIIKYRPISILPIIARVFEKLIHTELFRYLESTIFKYQSGFRPKHSTESSVLNSTNRWLLNIDQGNYSIAVFVDLKKAFNTVNHEILLNKLRYYGIGNTELKWFTSYLTDRKQYTVVDGAKSTESNVDHGVP